MPDPSDGPKAALRDAKLFIDRKKDESIRILVAIQAIQGDTAVHWVCSENCEGFDIASEMCDTVILEESYEEAYRIGYADGYIDGLVARTRAFVASLSDEQSPPIEAKLLDFRLPSASEPHGTGPVGDETDDLPAHDDSGSQRHTIEPTGEAPMPRFTLLVCPNGKTLRRDEDVLDTWFSSWLWPISVFDGIRYPDGEDVNYYYPTSVLVTGHDIIFFWVARMIISGYEYRNELPFKDVYFTGMVRDLQGRKMSKQLGNSPDALQLIEDFLFFGPFLPKALGFGPFLTPDFGPFLTF